MRWLAGLEVINHTTLSEFRTAHKQALNDLFAELLAVLDQVMHDGTKIQAQASPNSFRREKTVQARLEQARRVVEELGDPDDEQRQSRRDAARQRAAREKVQVLEAALAEVEKIRPTKSTAEEKADVRVSITEPGARVGESQKRGNTYEVYRAPGEVCSQCPVHQQCCPKGFQSGRTVSLLIQEVPAVAAFRQKMATEAAQQVYKRRSEVAESPNAWLKEEFGLRKFRLRGLEKARLEALWACLTYNVMQWIRLVWRKRNEPVLQMA